MDDALIYLNFLLQASQNPALDQSIYTFAQDNPGAISDFKIEFLAKWLIIKSRFTSPIILSPSELNWQAYLELSMLYDQIDDPIIHDPNFKNRNPVEVFVRMQYQQLQGQHRLALQSFGSAYLLFYETAARVATSVRYNIPERFRQLSGISIEQFMHLGFIFLASKAGPYGAIGTISQEYLNKAKMQGLDILTDENIQRFLDMTSCDHEAFRQVAIRSPYPVSDPEFVLYEFNPLKKFPLLQVHYDRWVAPNPALIIDRVTLGIYYDLLDADSTQFTQSFGTIFEEYVGDLLKSVYPETIVLREKVYGQPQKRGPADWVVIEGDTAILFECKSFIPNLNFVSISSQADIEQYARRVANAIRQTHQHINEIQAGEPQLQEFTGSVFKIVVLTVGRIQTVNTVFFKQEIDTILAAKGISNLSYTVLSLQEFELLLSLVERDVLLTELLDRLEGENQGEALTPYQEMLSQNATPSLVAQKGEEIITFFRNHQVS
ncbi:MAG: hypothetical protein KDJ65_02380 [Anaerolineae bacterium]|nr:hypothetical protein [Anaerolineae bacterium]